MTKARDNIAAARKTAAAAPAPAPAAPAAVEATAPAPAPTAAAAAAAIYGLPPSTTLNFNAVAPLGSTWRPYSNPAPGLRTVFNRGEWLSRHRIVDDDWTVADAWVDGCIAQGLAPLALMTDDPSKPFDEHAHWNHCVAVMRRYIGRVRDFEAGNEGDTAGNWCYDGDQGGATTGRMWRVTTDALRSIDPNCRVICGNIQSIWPGGHGLNVLKNALPAYGAGWVPNDLSLHAYPTSTEQIDMIPRMVERVRGVCAAHGKEEPRIWMTEWSMWPPQFSTMTAAEQAAFLRRMLTRFIDAGVYASLHYLFDDPNGFGFRDRAAGVGIWNAAVAAVYG
jgi:hypothetical protein